MVLSHGKYFTSWVPAETDTVPSQRSVYLKFKSMGYPTDPVGRMKLLDGQLPSNLQTESGSPFNAWTNSQSPPLYTSQYGGSGLNSPLGDSFAASAITLESGNGIGTPSSEQFFESMDTHGVSLSGDQETSDNICGDGSITHPVSVQALSSSLEPARVPSSWSPPNGGPFGASSMTFEHAYQFSDHSMELNGASYFGINDDCDLTCEFPESSRDHEPLPITSLSPRWKPEVDASEYRPVSSNVSMMDLDNSASFQLPPTNPFDASTGSVVKLPFQKLINTSGTGTRNRIRSLFRPKASNLSRGRKRYAVSQFTNSTEDSGYASGHASSLTLEEVRRINSQSLDEFNGLYRVACQTLHEPQGKAQCKDIPTCTSCQYSSIHNLGWSARYLKLEVFLSELKLNGVYNFGALDAAGNTALHYAAAGGAGYQHLKALIDVGVDPYLANTAGELFIYCLRPLEPFTLEPNSDCLKSDDLVNLLGLLQLHRVSNWRDNDGQTIMHTLALKITEPDLKLRIFA